MQSPIFCYSRAVLLLTQRSNSGTCYLKKHPDQLTCHPAFEKVLRHRNLTESGILTASHLLFSSLLQWLWCYHYHHHFHDNQAPVYKPVYIFRVRGLLLILVFKPFWMISLLVSRLRGCSSNISSSYFSVQQKSRACYITGQWGRVRNKIKQT